MANKLEGLLDILRVPHDKKIDLKKDYDPAYTGDWIDKDDAQETLEQGVQLLAEMQDKLYAQDNYAVLVVLQAMDAAGKDGTIKHVMSGVNPMGVNVYSFKAPAGEELDHDYMWRNFTTLPRRGNIGIFNRSHYEEVLVVRVHPEFLAGQKLPPKLKDKDIWKRRFEEINNFEKYLVNNGIVVVKFFLHVSRQAQKERFLERIALPEKNWKFSAGDVVERQRWDDYMDAYQDVLNNTSTKWAPWYVIPADHKWFMRLAVAEVLYQTMKGLDLAYPTVSEAQKAALLAAKEKLENEDGGQAAGKKEEGSPGAEAADAPQLKQAMKKDKKKNKKKGK